MSATMPFAPSGPTSEGLGERLPRFHGCGKGRFDRRYEYGLYPHIYR